MQPATLIIIILALTGSCCYCAETAEQIPVIDNDTPVEELEDVMWDPTATTYFQKVLDGDIAYFTDKMKFKDDDGRNKRAALKDRRFLWPNGVIPYVISSRYTVEERNIILAGMCHWENYTCIRFKPRTTESDYITIWPGAGCSSYIGQVGGNQGVSLARNCFAFHTGVHELGHVVGFFHEHSRPDRDDYVDIIYDEVVPGARSQFEKISEQYVDSLEVGYDYNSIMHYDHNLFSSSFYITTIRALDPNIVVGGRVLSKLDIIQTCKLYDCPKDNPPPRITLCPVSLPPRPPPFPAPAFPCWHTIDLDWPQSTTIMSPGYPSYTHNTDCAWMVRAPPGFKIAVTIQPMSIDRSPNCLEDYIEVFESLDTRGFSLGKHCGIYNRYAINSIKNVAHIHYHTNGNNHLSRLKGFNATIRLKDINECQNGHCSHNCMNLNGSYSCSCPEGYFLSSNGETCFDVQECALGNGGCEHKCVNRGGGYHCECEGGLVLQADGKSCGTSRDPCEEANCAHVCSVSGNQTRCSCREGYQLDTDERGCVDVNECLTNNGGCEHLCTNRVGSFECSCQPGYRLSSDGKSCDDINECQTNNGGCHQVCENKMGSFECSCRPGYRFASDGSTCVDINECSTDNGGCEDTCTNERGSFQCSCSGGYKLASDGKSCVDVNECTETRHGCLQGCINTAGSYRCTCRDGYELDSDGITCRAIPVTILTGLTGSFHTPNWPETYPVNVDLMWHIRCPLDNQKVDLTFSSNNFGIAGNLPDCMKDWIKVYDGEDVNAELMGTFCHYRVPDVLQSSSPNLLVELHAGPAHNPARQGFGASYTCITCPTTPAPIFTTEKTVETPTNPTVKSAPTTVAVGKTDPTTTSFEISEATIPIIIIEPIVVTVDSIQSTDDVDTIVIATEIPKPACGDVFTDDSGSFSSPNWPRTYPVNVDCEWIITCDQNNVIEIEFERGFGIAGNLPDCEKDWVKVVHGLHLGATESGPFCHYTNPGTITVSSNEAKVVLHAGPAHSPSRLGFAASYQCIDNSDVIPKPACGDVFYAESGSFHSPNWPRTYPVNVDCEWIMVCDQDEVVEIDFERNFGIAGNLPDCEKDLVKVVHGLHLGATESGPFCHYTNPGTITTSSSRAKVVLHAGPAHSPSRLGFAASYQCVAGS